MIDEVIGEQHQCCSNNNNHNVKLHETCEKKCGYATTGYILNASSLAWIRQKERNK